MDANCVEQFVTHTACLLPLTTAFAYTDNNSINLRSYLRKQANKRSVSDSFSLPETSDTCSQLESKSQHRT